MDWSMAVIPGGLLRLWHVRHRYLSMTPGNIEEWNMAHNGVNRKFHSMSKSNLYVSNKITNNHFRNIGDYCASFGNWYRMPNAINKSSWSMWRLSSLTSLINVLSSWFDAVIKNASCFLSCPLRFDDDSPHSGFDFHAFISNALAIHFHIFNISFIHPKAVP